MIKFSDVLKTFAVTCFSEQAILDDATLKTNDFYLKAGDVYATAKLQAEKVFAVEMFRQAFDALIQSLLKRYQFTREHRDLVAFNLRFAISRHLLAQPKAKKWDVFLLFAEFNPLTSAVFVVNKEEIVHILEKTFGAAEKHLFTDFLVYLRLFYVHRPNHPLFFATRVLANDLFFSANGTTFLLAPAGTVLPFHASAKLALNGDTACRYMFSDNHYRYLSGTIDPKQIKGELSVNLMNPDDRQIIFNLTFTALDEDATEKQVTKSVVLNGPFMTTELQFVEDERWWLENANAILAQINATKFTFSQTLNAAISQDPTNIISIAFELASLQAYNVSLDRPERINLQHYAENSTGTVLNDLKWDETALTENLSLKLSKKILKKHRGEMKRWRRKLFWNEWKKNGWKN